MAYTKSLLITDLFPNGDFNTSTQTFEIPLSDLTSVGLDLTESTAEDARKFVLAILQTMQARQNAIKTAYDASKAHPAYVEGADYEAGDKVQYAGNEWEADVAIVNAPATLDTASWTENNYKQPVDNATATQQGISWSADGSSGTQRHTLTVVYSNSYDVKSE